MKESSAPAVSLRPIPGEDFRVEGAKGGRIGELLVARGAVSEDQVRIALTEQRRARPRELLGRILVRLGFVTEALIRDVLGGALGCDSVDLGQAVIDSEILAVIPEHLARRHRILGLSRGSSALTVAMEDPFDVIALDQVRACAGADVELRPVLAGAAELDAAIDRFYGFELSIDGILREMETGEIDDRFPPDPRRPRVPSASRTPRQRASVRCREARGVGYPPRAGA